jgi:predicted metal-dependent hydrolase
MKTIKIANYPLTYSVIHKKNRKTVQLKITDSSHIHITAPHSFSNDAIEELLLQKSKWIIKHISHLVKVAESPINKSVTNNSTILYLGHPHTLAFLTAATASPTVYLEGNQIILNLPSNNTDTIVQTMLKQWYVKKSSEILSSRTTFWSSKISVNPKRITIKEQKTRWGSCSSKGNINYNWRIIMAPPEVVDYLVIHELCHLRVPNHSELFWQEVSKYSPHFQKHRDWLRANGRILMGIL